MEITVIAAQTPKVADDLRVGELSVEVSGFGSRHSYVFDNPSVLSDLVHHQRRWVAPAGRIDLM